MHELQIDINEALNELVYLIQRAKNKGFDVYDQDDDMFFLPDHVFLYPKE